MPQQFFEETLGNGLRLICQPMNDVSSAAYSLLLPTGVAYDSLGQVGASALLAELSSKSTKSLDSRSLSEAWDNLGISRGQSAGISMTSYSGALLSENLGKGLGLLSQVVNEPNLNAEELVPVKELAIQEIKSLEDEPARQVMVELGKQFYPEPFGRSQLGELEDVSSVSADDLKKLHSKRFKAGNMILGVAGKIDRKQLLADVETYFGALEGKADVIEPPALSKKTRSHFIERDTSQVQIALAFPSVSYSHPDYYAARVAVGVLSGGMSGRLFIEVREKRGLVYGVFASHNGAEGRSSISAYAGTTPENAEECLGVMCEQLASLKDGVSEEELQRAKADLKSRLVIQGESSSSRAAALASDVSHLGRPRSLEEVSKAIDQVSASDIAKHWEEFPLESVCLVSMGKTKLEMPDKF